MLRLDFPLYQVINCLIYAIGETSAVDCALIVAQCHVAKTGNEISDLQRKRS